MEDLQLVLLIMGAIAIIAVLVHGFWSIRRQQPKGFKQKSMAKVNQDQRDGDGFDEVGIGAVRVMPHANEPTANKQSVKAVPTPDSENANTHTEQHVKATADSAASSINIDSDDINSLETQPAGKQAFENQPQATQPQPVSASKDTFCLTDKPSQKIRKSAKSRSARTEPVISASHVRDQVTDQQLDKNLAFDLELDAGLARKAKSEEDKQTTSFEKKVAISEHTQLKNNTAPEKAKEPQQANSEAPKLTPLPDPVDVLVLHVVAPEGELLQGAELLPSLLTLNFKFGDKDIFHRHVDNAGKGYELFSLANMVKPGTFNPDMMEQFSTPGVVLFMTLPCHGDALMNFTIMLNSAQQIADDLGAQLLDETRNPWTNSTKQAYLQRVKAQLAVSA